MKYTPWLDRWAELLNGKYALDIGCGLGKDTEELRRLGFEVTAIDLSDEALKKSKKRNPDAVHLQRDISKGLNLEKDYFSVVLANLSLHYFSRTDTFKIFEEIGKVLVDEGVVAFRVNAEGDTNSGCPERLNGWDLTTVDGVEKQFFSKEKIEELINGSFEFISLEKMIVERYGTPKILWECIARKQ
jgi:SAM-dependent methyltransferase